MLSARIEQLLNAYRSSAAIGKTFGMSLSFDENGCAVVDLPYNPGLDHAMNGIHGGVYMTLIDTAAWFTAAAAHEEQVWLATSELTVHFLKPASNTSLRCIGKVLKPGKRQDIVEAYLYDGEGQLVGHGVGTFILLPDIPM